MENNKNKLKVISVRPEHTRDTVWENPNDCALHRALVESGVAKKNKVHVGCESVLFDVGRFKLRAVTLDPPFTEKHFNMVKRGKTIEYVLDLENEKMTRIETKPNGL